MHSDLQSKKKVCTSFCQKNKNTILRFVTVATVAAQARIVRAFVHMARR